MIRTGTLALPALALAALLVGCNDAQKTTQADLLSENEDLHKQIADKDDKLNAIGEQLARAQQQASELQTQLEACNQRAAAPAPATVTAVDTKDFQGIEGVEASVQGNDIHLTIASSLLFDSGKTSLKDSARRSLDKVSAAIKEKYGDREIMVVGYTDTDPIRRSSFASNYHLGFERAFAVRGYLDRKGVPGANMGLVSFGPDRPEGSKERSRRVEVIVTAKVASPAGDALSRAERPLNAPEAATKVPAKSAPARQAKSAAKSSR